MVLGEDLDAEIERQEKEVAEQAEYIREQQAVFEQLKKDIPLEKKELKLKQEKLKEMKETKVNLSIFDRRFLEQSNRVDKRHIGQFLEGARNLFNDKDNIKKEDLNAYISKNLPQKFAFGQ